jgi:hypothetical protein
MLPISMLGRIAALVIILGLIILVIFGLPEMMR